MELLPHLLEHALEDTIYLVPFLLITYILLELLEHKAGDHAVALVQKAGIAGPLVGAILGAVPQCGFSAAGSALYASRAITLGTLFAVFLSTSDEMLPLFIAEQVDPAIMLSILGTKVLIGMVMGFAIDGVLRLRVRARIQREKETLEFFHEHDHHHTASGTAHDHAHEHNHKHSHLHPPVHNHNHEHHSYEHCEARSAQHETHVHSREDDHEHNDNHSRLTHEELERPFSHHHCHNPSCNIEGGTSTWKDILISALKHTLQVSIIVYLISFVLVAILELAGEDAITTFLISNPTIAIFGSALVGLIPNCGASVVITQLYLDGMLGTGAMLSGLLVSAGVGILVLFSENHRLRQNILILLGLLITGIAWGMLFEVLGVQFV